MGVWRHGRLGGRCWGTGDMRWRRRGNRRRSASPKQHRHQTDRAAHEHQHHGQHHRQPSATGGRFAGLALWRRRRDWRRGSDRGNGRRRRWSGRSDGNNRRFCRRRSSFRASCRSGCRAAGRKPGVAHRAGERSRGRGNRLEGDIAIRASISLASHRGSRGLVCSLEISGRRPAPVPWQAACGGRRSAGGYFPSGSSRHASAASAP